MGNIDLSTVSNWTPIGNSSTAFTGTFNGNGYTISNLTINTLNDDAGLFGYTNNSTIENVGLTNVKVTGGYYMGGLVGTSYGNVSNCYSTGSVDGNSYVGGLVGNKVSASILNSYATGSATGLSSNVGGAIGNNSGTCINVKYNSSKNINAIGSGSSIGITGLTSEQLADSSSLTSLGLYVSSTYKPTSSELPESNIVSLQVGINSSKNSIIDIDSSLNLSLSVDLSSTDSARTSLDSIDDVLKTVSEKQTELGASANRLESANDAKSTNIYNLTSSLSTVKDADITTESSTYINQQIM